MSTNKMFVPSKIKVGYQNRQGTYTGKLAYVVYYDNKNKLRKEASWEGWRDKAIDPAEFTNEPTSGFVLNKGVGGVRGSYGWDARNEYIRVYDPRDFEFEISVANLLFILQETSAIKGKGLEGEFVYAWDGTELVLLPVGSAEYQACVEHTERQDKKVVAKDVKPGFSYKMKNGTNVMYLGKFQYLFEYDYYEHTYKSKGLKHIFLDLDDLNPKWGDPYIAESGFTKLAEVVSPSALPTYPDELERFQNSRNYADVVDVLIEDENHENVKSQMEDYRGANYLVRFGKKYKKVSIRKYHQDWYSRYNKEENDKAYSFALSEDFVPELKNGELRLPETDTSYYNKHLSQEEFNKLEFKKLYAVNAKGFKIEVL